MKKRRVAKLVICILLVTGLLVSAVPYLLNLNEVRSWLTEELSHQLNSKIDIKAISWHWFPLPHIELTDSRVSNNRFNARLPGTQVFPDWWSLFRGRREVGRIVLNSPFVHIKSLPESGKGESQLPLLPSVAFVIKNGSLILNSQGILPGKRHKTEHLKFSNVQARGSTGPDVIDASLECVPPSAEKLKASGHFMPSKASYELGIDCQGLKLHKCILASLMDGPVTPVDSDVNIKAAITGIGTDKIKGSIKGDFPCLRIKSHDKEILFSCGNTDLGFEKQGERLSISVNTLELSDPELTLSGIIEKRQPAGSNEAVWHLDLEAGEIDLSGVRKRILALFGRHEVADLVCNIVRGGKAKGGRYIFEGTVPDFRKLEAMIITADVETAPIHVPNVDLDLKETCGQIEIRDGILTGKNLSARLGNSVGRNGSLTLGLLGKDKVFNLSMDLDADLSKLPPLLHRLVNHQGFRDELAKFTNVRGKTSGRLILGDMLNKISVRVDVSSIDGEADYQRISWPIRITTGQLQVLPEEVNWSDIEGVVGPHVVHNTEGSVRWGDMVCLDITGLNASLDSGPLYAELMRYPRLEEVLSKVLLSIDGPMEVKDSMLKGSVQDPLNWEYRLTADIEGLNFHSPLLPGPSNVQKASVKASQDSVLISQCNMRLSDQQMDLEGELEHRKWQDWQGWVELSGTARKGLSLWVKEKGWIPARYFPRTPCTLDHLKIAWDRNGVDVRGKVLKEEGPEKAIKVKLDLSSRAERFSIKDLTITTPRQEAVFSLDLQQTPKSLLLLSWKGNLSGNTLDKILEDNKLLSGYLKGSCNLTYHLGEPGSIRLNGSVETRDFRWEWGLTEPLDIKYADLQGHKSWTDIEKLSLGLNGESVRVSGRASFSKRDIDLDLDLESESLSWENLSGFLKSYKENNLTNIPKSANGTHPFSLTGRINFNLDKFEYPGRQESLSPDAEHQATNYVWQPLTGQVKLLPQGKASLSVSSGIMCGLNTTGTWRSGPNHGLTTLFISTDHEKKALFQYVLSCLGYDQDLIEGPFVLNASLEGALKNWQRGKVELHSANGKIKRMTLLSKIFSVINVIDLFSLRGLPDLFTEGFAYSEIEIKGDIKDNNLIINKAVIKGKGLNLFGYGKVDLGNTDANMTVLASPFKILDAIVSKVPLLGKTIVGKDGAIIAYPVKIKGPIRDPKVTLMP